MRHGIDLTQAETETPDQLVVVEELPVSMNASARGIYLLRLEAVLTSKLGRPVTVYLKAADDRNALRKFRGVLIHDDSR